MLKRNKLIPLELEVQRERKETFNFLKPAEPEVTEEQRRMAMSDEQLAILDRPEPVALAQREVNFDALHKLFNPVQHRDIVVFLQSLVLLKKANFNNIEAINTIRKSTENINLRETLNDIQSGLEEGYYMYEMLERYPKEFPHIVTNMIKVGELSGSFVEAIEQAIEYIEKEFATTRAVKKAVIPNLATFLAIMLLLIVGTLVAIPAIQNVYDTMGSTEKLPAVTRWFASFLNTVIATWYIPVGIITVFIIVFTAYIKTPIGKYKWHGFKYKAPIFGKLIYTLDFSKLIRSLLLNLRAGLRIQDALEVSRNLINNVVMVSLIEQSLNSIYNGDSWIEPFEKSGYGTPMATDMLHIGMDTDLTAMMDKIVEILDYDVQLKLERIMKILPQVSYLIVGGALIFLTLVVLVPSITLYMGGFMFSAYGV